MNPRTPATSVPNPLPAQTLWLVLAGFLGAVLLNLHHTALWCAPVALGAAAWRTRAVRPLRGLPGRMLRIGIALVLTLAVLVSFRTLNGVAAGASLLVAMVAMKLTETASQRDWLIVIGAVLFLLLAACLDAPALWRLPLYACELWLLCTGLYALGAGASEQSVTGLLRRSGRTLAAAAPFALVLFLFVPRLPGSFWALPEDDQALTGLSDEMSPGSFSQLSESDEPALHVRFDGALPPPAERYWRGPVLHNFDGYSWHRGAAYANLGGAPPLQHTGRGYSYEVTLEPSSLNNLIALELPDGTEDALTTFDYQLISPQPLDRAISYRLESYPQHRALSSTARNLDLDLRRQSGRNPRSMELARSLRAGVDDDAAFVAAVLAYLQHGGFSYTLTPQKLSRDSVDDLLFRTREGFCGHYASAFVMMMRAGGVPARVVTGYLGGQWNRFGGYLLIRQADAHAWAEVWLDGRGWVRVDPTAVVAPARLTRGVEDLLPAARPGLDLRTAPPWMVNTVQAWQAANAWWQDEFIDFNFTKQLNLLGMFGLRDHPLRTLAILLAVGASIWLALLAWSLRLRRRAPAPDGLGRAWRTLERKLRRATAPRAAHEGPIAYAARVGRARPELAATVNALARRYARLRYGPSASAVERQQFRQAVKLLRWPPPSAR